jgi:long-subunit fatty acid transport protein
MRNSIGFFATGLILVAQMALGAGYEKSVMWSGKQAGVAGSGTATTKTSESLYFNPAGLADVKGIEVSGNFSPTWVQSKAPVTTNDAQLTGDSLFIPVGGFTAAYKLSDNLGIGAGAFVSGGTRAKYSNVNIGLGFNPDYLSEINLMEYSLGVAYKVLPGFKLGAAWRILHATGKLSLPKAALGGAIHMDNLAATKYNGFRFGGQYEGDNWGMGLTIRTGIDFTLSGDLSLQTGASTSTSYGTGTAANSFPVEATLGGYYDASKDLRLIAEYTYANYAKNKQLDFTGSLLGGAVNLANSPIKQEWKDLHVGRVAAEYRGWGESVLRAGYALVGQVTPKEYAAPTFSSPGTGHTITVGGGHSYLNKSLDLDLAFEYSFASGSVATSDIPAGNTTTKAGDYSSHALAGHIGATYRF